MADKIKTLTLSFPHTNPEGGKLYRVEKATDTVKYAPDQYLQRKEVSELCEAKGWKVTIQPPKE